MVFSTQVIKKLEKIETYDMKEFTMYSPGSNVMEYYEGATLQKALLKYAELGRIKDVNVLLSEENIYINVQNYVGETPLMVAARFGKIPMMENLLARGADIGIRNNAGMTVLMRAVASGKIEVVRFLLEQEGINIEDTDNYQRTAFKFSVIKSKFNIMLELLKKECKIPKNIASYIDPVISAEKRQEIVKILSELSKVINHGIPCQDVYKAQEHYPLDIGMRADLTLSKLFPIGCNSRDTSVEVTSDRYVLIKPLDSKAQEELLIKHMQERPGQEAPKAFAVVVENAVEYDSDEDMQPGNRKEGWVSDSKLSDLELCILEDGNLSQKLKNADSAGNLEEVLTKKGLNTELTAIELAIINRKEIAVISILDAIKNSEIFNQILSHNGIHNINILSLAIINDCNEVVSKILKISEDKGTLTTVLSHTDDQGLTPYLFAEANKKPDAVKIINKAVTNLWLSQKASEQSQDDASVDDISIPRVEELDGVSSIPLTIGEGDEGFSLSNPIDSVRLLSQPEGPLLLENGNANSESNNALELPNEMYFYGGVLAGNIAARGIKFLDDQITGENPDKSFYEYLPNSSDLIKSAIFSIIVASLPNSILLANKIIIAKSVSDVAVHGVNLTPEYAASMSIYIINSIVSFNAIGLVKQTELYESYPFATGAIAATASEVMNLCYDIGSMTYNHIAGEDSSMGSMEEAL